MKKEYFLVFLALTLILSFVSGVYAADASSTIQENTGINPDKINDLPKTPEELKETYLKQSWSELIAKNKYLGPVHAFLLKISPLFVILFAENYSLSFALLGVICLWFYVLMELSTVLGALGTLNSWASKLIALGGTIILAHVGAYRAVIGFIGNLAYSEELWWARLLVIAGAVVVAYVLHEVTKLVEKQMKLSKANAKTRAVEDEVEKQSEFIKGMKKGTKTFE